MSSNELALEASRASIELVDLPNSQQSTRPTSPHFSAEELRRDEASALHPVDEGFHAWLFVFCAFVLETIVWGFPFSYGIFQDWYLTHEFRNASEASVNSVGTITLAIQYSEGLLCAVFARYYLKYRRTAMVVGLVLSASSMFASSFATQVWQLILFQGVVYGLAAGFMYVPVIFWLSEWFVEKRSLAGSLIFGGSGLGGSIFPLIMTYLLESVGFRWTLRIWSGLLILFGGLAILGTKPRLPLAPNSTSAPVNFVFLTQPLFVAVASTIFIQGLAYFCVSLYIPSYATSLGYSRIEGTIALAVFNLASVVGQVMFGAYCDIRPFTHIMVFSGLLSSVLAYALWGLAHKLTTVFIFVVFFGSISGGFSSVWPSASSSVSGNQPSVVFFCFSIAKGLSAVTGPLIAAALHPKKVAGYTSKRGGWGGYGFTGITIFVGTAMAATALMSIASSMIRHRVSSRAP